MMYLFETAINFYQGFLLIYFLRNRLCQTDHSVLWEIGSILAIGASLSIIQFAGLPLSDNLIFIFPLIYACRINGGKKIYCVLWTFLEMMLFLGTINLVGNLICFGKQVEWQTLLDKTPYHAAYVAGSNMALTLVVCVLGGKRKEYTVVSTKATVIFILLLGFSFLTNECVFWLQVYDGIDLYPTLATISLLVISALSVALYEMMNSDALKRRKTELTIQTLHLEQSHQEELQTIYKNMLATQHDLYHRISTAEEILARSADISESSRAEVLQLLQTASAMDTYVTGNIAMDAILKAKTTTMKQAGIHFEYVPYPLHTLPIAEQEFCVLICNILDNAIEGVMRLPASASSRNIRLVLSQSWDMFSITCTNDADGSTVRKIGGIFHSSKENAELHGFGTQSIRSIVKDAGGVVDFYVSPHMFTVEMMLPLGNDHDTFTASTM